MKGEFSEAELKEIKRLHHEVELRSNWYQCSLMADGRAWFDEEPLRKQWSKEEKEFRAKIYEIANGRDWIKALYGGK